MNQKPEWQVCDSCIEAMEEFINEIDSGPDRPIRVIVPTCVSLGADVPDHLCTRVDCERCDCACGPTH